MIVYAAIAGLFGMMGIIVWYASLDNPELEQVEIKLLNVEVKDVNKIENSAKLEITFLVKNPSEKTFTVPIIGYQLYADGQLLGSVNTLLKILQCLVEQYFIQEWKFL